MKTKVDPFKAIADPRRRKIIQLLIISSTLTLSAITENFKMSRQAITRHIDTLADAGILKTKKQGREVYYYLDMKPLKEVIEVANYYKSFWENKLDRLDVLIENRKS